MSRSKKYYAANKEAVLAQKREYLMANGAVINARRRERYKAEREKILARNRRYAEANRAAIAEKQAAYVRANPDKVAAKWMRRHAAKLQRTTPWSDRVAIAAFYEMAARVSRCLGVEHHVDHVLPLRGKTVSGLHVPLNLRVVPAVVNRRKGNKV